MGFRYYRRKKVGNSGGGFNFSKSGIGYSVRKKWGSVGTRGYSIRTGIPGLSYRGGYGKNGILAGLITLILFGVFILAWNILKVIGEAIAAVLQSVFKEKGIDYNNLSVVLGCIFAILIAVDFYLPEKTSAQNLPVSLIVQNSDSLPKKQVISHANNPNRRKIDSIDLTNVQQVSSPSSDSVRKGRDSSLIKQPPLLTTASNGAITDSTAHKSTKDESQHKVISMETPEYVRVELAVGMLKRGKTIDEIMDSTYLKKHQVKKLKRNLNL